MAYTVKQLASLAGISPRTLHYYDELGLLKPSAVRPNGYREYDQRALLQLQQIMFYKEMGLSLAQIEDILFIPGFDLLEALKTHRKAMEHNAARLNKLLNTIDNTIKHLEGETNMSDKEFFDGFSEEKQKQYEQDIVAEFGPDDKRFKESIKRWARYSKTEQKEMIAGGKEFFKELGALVDKGAADPKVQTMIAQLHESVNKFWECDLVAFSALGNWYLTKPDFVKTYQSYHPDLPEFINEAIQHYVNEQSK